MKLPSLLFHTKQLPKIKKKLYNSSSNNFHIAVHSNLSLQVPRLKCAKSSFKYLNSIVMSLSFFASPHQRMSSNKTHAQKERNNFAIYGPLLNVWKKNDILTQHLPHGTIAPVPLDFPHRLTTSPTACINKLEMCSNSFFC